MSLMRAALFAGLLMSAVGCQAVPPVPPLPAVPQMSPLLIPRDVQRIAVLYPKSTSPDMADAYNRLEGATFQLKVYRPDLKIVDRFHLPIVQAEHRFQLAGAVGDDSAIRIGRVLGVDTVLIYRIDGPSNRDRMWARSHRDLPPVTVTSKVIRVESAEVLYHRVIVARIEDSPSWGWSLTDSMDYQRLSREAIERGIMQTVAELGRAME
ncbi:MAG TPA: hypothetical protein VLE03_07330 [Nitrospiraceae bacterium]|nr:hypothetical protein [Nitrospiraceae bacterium]